MTIIIVRLKAMKKNDAQNRRNYGGIDTKTRKKMRKEQLVSAGLEAFGTLGFAKSKIKDICQIAGLTERYFYESFKNKGDLFFAVYRFMVEDMEKAVIDIFKRPNLDPKEATAEALNVFFYKFKDDPRRARIQFFEILGVDYKIARQYRVDTLALISRIRHINNLIFGLDPDHLKNTILAESMAGAIIEVARGWALDGFEIPVEAIVSQLMDMLLVLGNHYKTKIKGI